MNSEIVSETTNIVSRSSIGPLPSCSLSCGKSVVLSVSLLPWPGSCFPVFAPVSRDVFGLSLACSSRQNSRRDLARTSCREVLKLQFVYLEKTGVF